MRDAIERSFKRLLGVVGRGRVTLVADAGPVQLIQIRHGPDEIRDGTPRLAEYGFASRPPAGSDAITLSIGGDRNHTVTIATNHQASRFRNLSEGEVALHDDRGRAVYLSATGIRVYDELGQAVRLLASGIQIVAPNGVQIVGDSSVTGAVAATGNLSVTGTVTATGEGTFNGGHTVSAHRHGGVATGGSQTNLPTG